MLSLSPATRIFVALEPVDLRQSFNGLSARVQSVLAQDPLLCGGLQSVAPTGRTRERPSPNHLHTTHILRRSFPS
jgi:IS66 Orf2 like protein